MCKFLICIIFFFGFSSSTNAQFVIPDERVEEGVTIRAQPSSQSQNLGLLRPGERIPFDGAVARWNRVRLPNGNLAFLSKGWTDVIDDLAPGSFTIHAVDVGTGLAIVVEGEDFVLIYDGGSNDDTALGDENRLIAYLRAAIPGLTNVDHLILSHPHTDHVLFMADVIAEYAVGHVWDSGRLHDVCGYRAFLSGVASEPGVTYHNALGNFGTHSATFVAKRCFGQNLPAETINVSEGARIGDSPVALGATGRMRFLHADGAQHSSPNENSVVVRLDLGLTRVLLMGDAEAGGRHPPSHDADDDSIEGLLLDCCEAELKADILVVGHHGSMTSSRSVFLDAVDADMFVVSSGPRRFGSVVLPDQEVITELEGRGTVFRTDTDDAACETELQKVGPDNDNEPGGCDNIQIRIAPDATISGAIVTITD